jgi:hypothetical protein
VLKPAIIKYFRSHLNLFAVIVIFLWHATVVANTQILQNDEIMVVYEPPLEAAAGDVLRIYPILRQDLENFFGWHLNIKPQVVLITDKNLIVIDYSRMSTRPFNLGITLKHELCHLLLHEHINSADLPKWLDEGVCQWASDGIGEILVDKNWSGLDAAIMAGQTLRLSQLTKRFPGDRSSLTLAYEQSKSVVTYMDRQYGKQAILTILGDLKNGERIETAIFQNLSLSINQLEKDWLSQIERTPRWLVFLANNIYGILFFAAALLTICGFFLKRIHKRRWEDEEEEDDGEV